MFVNGRSTTNRATIIQRIEGHNLATELSQSAAPPFRTVYLRDCVLLTIILYSSAGNVDTSVQPSF